MADETNSNAIEILTDINTRLKDLDEKQSLLKEKVLLIGQSFLKQEEGISKEIALIRDDIREIKNDMERMKEAINHIVNESANFARKEELRIIERYMKLWEPLKFVKEDEVRSMISEALKK